MVHKKLLRPERLRKTPPQFSWLDHRLIRQARLRDCDPPAWALYLFLACVGDERGLSYYSDATLTRELRLDTPTLSQARRQLIRADLLAYEQPLWQLLSLESPRPNTPAPSPGGTRVAFEVLRRIFEQGGGL